MDNINLLPENEYTEFDSRRYLDPNLQVTQTNEFIDKLRATQQANNQQINAATQNLGTAVPSNLGGLTGSNSYFTSRFQTPQTSAATANLRAAAQAAALNQALTNEKAMWDKRYQDAYKNYQKRQNDKTNTTTIPSVGSGLEADVNETSGQTDVSLYDPTKEAPFGKVTLGTDGSTRWVDPKTGYQYLLQSPREIDVMAVNNTLVGANPADGDTQVINGKTLVYDSATNMWYERGPMIFGGGAR